MVCLSYLCMPPLAADLLRLETISVGTCTGCLESCGADGFFAVFGDITPALTAYRRREGISEAQLLL